MLKTVVAGEAQPVSSLNFDHGLLLTTSNISMYILNPTPFHTTLRKAQKGKKPTFLKRRKKISRNINYQRLFCVRAHKEFMPVGFEVFKHTYVYETFIAR